MGFPMCELKILVRATPPSVAVGTGSQSSCLETQTPPATPFNIIVVNCGTDTGRCDNCPMVYNKKQRDIDKDHIGDVGTSQRRWALS